MSTKKIQILNGASIIPKSDWNQTDETKADYIKNKPTDLATENYVDEKVAGIVNSAPETLDTLNELAEALGNDPNFATTVATEIGKKVEKVEGKGLSTNDFTTEEKNKLANITEGAEINIQSDWSQTDNTKADYIKNKPTKVSQFENDVRFTKFKGTLYPKNKIILGTEDYNVYDSNAFLGGDTFAANSEIRYIATENGVKDYVSKNAAAAESCYNDICPKDSGASENDLKIAVADLANLEGQVIGVKPNVEKNTSPYITGRMYLLNINQSIHSASQQVGYPIAVVDPDTGEYVKGDITHYNKYSVPMNFKGMMRLLIKNGFAIWLNPPFYYAIDADPYLGKNLVPYDDVDWKCKIIRGEGFATIQGVCRVDSGKTLNPNVAGEREIIGTGLPFRPMSHTQGKWCSKFAKTSGVADNWVCQADYRNGGIWVKSGSALSGTDDFCVNVTFPVWSKND